jgi:hypothetical protein
MGHAHLALGAVALVVYIRTMYPTVSGGDAGELMTVACNLGVAHPPGYPLWTWLAHGLATWRGLVPGVATTPAWRVSLLSAFGNAGAASLGTLTLRDMLVGSSSSGGSGSSGSALFGEWCAVLGGGLFAFFPNIWRYAGQAEVFGLHNLLVASMLFCLGRFNAAAACAAAADEGAGFGWDQGAAASAASAAQPNAKSRGAKPPARAPEEQALPPLAAAPPRQQQPGAGALRWAHATALCCGLAMSNQHTSAVYILPIATWVALRLLLLRGARGGGSGGGSGGGGARGRGSLLCARSFATLVLAGLSGLLPYAHLPWAARRRVMDTWGDQSTLGGFWTHVTREEYGTFVLASMHELGLASQGSAEIALRLGAWAVDLRQGSLGVAPPLLLLGALGALLPQRMLPARAFGSCGSGACAPAGGLATQRLLLFILVFYLGVMAVMANLPVDNAFHLGIMARMWQQADLVAMLLAGAGAHLAGGLALALAGRWGRGGGGRSSGGGDQGQGQGQGQGGGWQQAAAPPAFACLVLAFLAALCGAHWPLLDQHANHSIARYGRAMLAATPRHALLLVNEDVNQNAAKYVQQCEGERPDVAIVSIPLITYTWWRRTQLHHHPRLVFPGTHHHPWKAAEGSFPMKALLDANVGGGSGGAGAGQQGKKPPVWPGGVYVAGSWKTGDDSQNVYHRVPLGLVDRVDPPGGAALRKDSGGNGGGAAAQLLRGYEKELRAAAKRLRAAGMAGGLALAAPRPASATADSWERIVQRKLLAALATPAHHIAERYTALVDPSAPKKRAKLVLKLLRRAQQLYAEAHVLAEEDERNAHLVAELVPAVWRNAGIIAGELAARLHAQREQQREQQPPGEEGEEDEEGEEEQARVTDNMFTFWRTYLHRAAADDEMRGQFETLVADGVNPYGGNPSFHADSVKRSALRGRRVAMPPTPPPTPPPPNAPTEAAAAEAGAAGAEPAGTERTGGAESGAASVAPEVATAQAKAAEAKAAAAEKRQKHHAAEVAMAEAEARAEEAVVKANAAAGVAAAAQDRQSQERDPGPPKKAAAKGKGKKGGKKSKKKKKITKS